MGNKKSKALQKDATLEVEREYEQMHLQKIDTAFASCMLSEFDLMRTLGTGTFGRVRLAAHPSFPEPIALKILNKAQAVALGQVDHLLSERQVLLTVVHPFIVRQLTTFQNPTHLFMALEYVCGGEMFSCLSNDGYFKQNRVQMYASEVYLALFYLHKKNIVYRDLKPENLLIDAEGHVKITDFGFAKVIPKGRTFTTCGTPDYLPPEIILSKGHGFPVDWYALGILIFEMSIGYAPFEGESSMDMYKKILSGKISWPRTFSKTIKSLISKLVHKDHTKRITAIRIQKHKYFAGVDWVSVFRRETVPEFVPQVNDAWDTSLFDDYGSEIELDRQQEKFSEKLTKEVRDKFKLWDE
eukprot:g2684.t1